MASLDPAFRVLEANTDFFHRFGRSPDHVRGPSIQLISAKNLLTPIDAKVLEGVAAGISTIQLATLLFLSRGGVEYHVATLMRKFKVTNRPALVSKCYSTGVFVLGSWPPRVLPEYTK
jgi:DNA-binding CsgD family transcriptional regulator